MHPLILRLLNISVHIDGNAVRASEHDLPANSSAHNAAQSVDNVSPPQENTMDYEYDKYDNGFTMDLDSPGASSSSTSAALPAESAPSIESRLPSENVGPSLLDDEEQGYQEPSANDEEGSTSESDEDSGNEPLIDIRRPTEGPSQGYKFTEHAAVALDPHVRRSLELYCLVQEENISRKAYEQLIQMFNKWIAENDFGE